jgi:PAS domain S-box-containing protein/putative nucleotidyltransferase with HDIG domain
LRNSERHYRLLAENVSDVIWVTNLDLRLTYISPSVTRLLGYSVEETMALRFEGVLTPASADIGRNALAVALTAKREDLEGPQTLEVEMKRKDGSTFWAESTHRFVWDEHGQPCGILGVLRDITERQEVRERLQQTLKKLERTMEGTIQSISRMVETRDPYTAGHQCRVTQLACAMAREMGLKSEHVQVIRIACLLHDLGKIGIPAEVLNKPGRLSEHEFGMIRTHAQVGYDILKPVEFPWPVAEIVLQHHERLDGSGYPLGLHDEDISLEAKILAVADVVEAMSSHRPYRPALGIDEALKEISHNSGILYDPDAVYACLGLFTQKGFKLDKK